jgi:hypothetical protein
MASEDSRLEKAVQKGVNYYLDNLELRQSIWQIPYIGNAVDYIFSELGKSFQQRRLLQAIQYLTEETSQISESKVDKSFLDTEEFYDLIMRTLESCIKTRHNDKIRLYCKILIGAVLIDNRDQRHSAEDFLALIAELSLMDLQVGMDIYKRQKNMPEKFNLESRENNELEFTVRTGWHNICSSLEMNETDFKIALYKLSRAGLIKEIVGTYVGYTGGHYIITPAFKILMDLIKYSNEPTFNYKIASSIVYGIALPDILQCSSQWLLVKVSCL